MSIHDFDRRKFVTTTAAGMFAYGFGRSIPLLADERIEESRRRPVDGVYDCIVLGAGIAGLTAAHRLRAAGKSVLVLEASQRLGGRIHTVGLGQWGPAEMGAEFVHAPPNSVPLWQDIYRLGLSTTSLAKFDRGRIYHSSFRNLPRKGQLRKPNWAGLRAGPLRMASLFKTINRYNGTDMSAGHWIRQRFNPGLQRDLASMALTGHMPGTLDDLSIRGFASDRVSSQMMEKNEYSIRGGYKTLVDGMAKGLDIETDTVVERVVQNEGELVSIDARRVQSAENYQARSVICTFSVGMLKKIVADHPDFFQPGLPEITNQALQALEPGYHTKLVMTFNRAFWPSDMTMVHNPDSRRLGCRSYFRMYYGDGRRPALNALVMSEDAKRLDALSDSEAVGRLTYDLGQMFRQPVNHYLTSFRRYRWMSDDPYALGGNAYLKTQGHSPLPVWQVRRTLARGDLTGRMVFAGEATALSTQPGSVHGAHASALRAVGQTLRCLG